VVCLQLLPPVEKWRAARSDTELAVVRHKTGVKFSSPVRTLGWQHEAVVVFRLSKRSLQRNLKTRPALAVTLSTVQWLQGGDSMVWLLKLLSSRQKRV
jgi:hypothetical protein